MYLLAAGGGFGSMEVLNFVASSVWVAINSTGDGNLNTFSSAVNGCPCDDVIVGESIGIGSPTCGGGAYFGPLGWFWNEFGDCEGGLYDDSFE